MKKILLIATLIVTSVIMYAQDNVTKFLGIPVDGTKEEMIQKLMDKGFVVEDTNNSYGVEVLKGEFNGNKVNVILDTNKGKVCRVMVCYTIGTDESNIKTMYNNLCRQFSENRKYIQSELADYIIPDDENIRYEMTIHKKQYQAGYYQLPSSMDSESFREETESYLLSKYTKEELSNMTSEEAVLAVAGLYIEMQDKYSNNVVWFTISRNDYTGKYHIIMYYDNKHNMAHGEDL